MADTAVVPGLLSVSDYISQKFRVTVADGRRLQGTLVAVDDHSNMLMSDVVEYFQDELTAKTKVRQIGLVSVPRKTIEKVEIDRSDYVKTAKWKLSSNSSSK